jgi:hypothetical protein
MQLSELENDILGDLNEDTHGVWEVFEFARMHHPSYDDQQIFEIGRGLLQSWNEKQWLRLSDTPLYPTRTETLGQMLEQINQLGVEATRYYEGAPSIELTTKTYEDVAWLRRAI